MLAFPKPSLRVGVIAAVLCLVLAYGAIPSIYGAYGEGPMLVRQAVSNSKKINGDCGHPSTFVMVPWHLAIEDSESNDNLSLRYWFRCGNQFGTVDGRFFHNGGGWIAKEVEAHIGKQSYTLVANKPRGTP